MMPLTLLTLSNTRTGHEGARLAITVFIRYQLDPSITQFGNDAPNVVGLVCESAFAPDRRETMKDLISGSRSRRRGAALRPVELGFMWLDPARTSHRSIDPLPRTAKKIIQRHLPPLLFMASEPRCVLIPHPPFLTPGESARPLFQGTAHR
jgi:hypothetical protein